PVQPGERLDLLAQGDVVHRVLARCVGAGENVDDVFEQEFRRICAERRIPDSYRTEAVRLDLLRDLRRFISECDLPAAKHLLEKPFELELPDGVVLRGRFDRVDIYPDDRALVVDYKYSRAANLRDRFKKTDEAKSVQGGLYLLGLKRSLGHEPAGMLFAGLRGEASWRGWHVSVPGLRHGKRCADEDLGGLVAKATQAFETALGKIRRGRILPEPEDDKLCEWCEYCDICRVESAAWSAAAGGLEEAEG
ncbi:MAG: PD-(D/E)XK nuclease family protein, partial [Bryobacteraceae bacterium]